MIFAAHGIKMSQTKIAKEMKTPLTMHEGTKPERMVHMLAKHGFGVQAGQRKKISDITHALNQNVIVVVCYTDPFDQYGHYVIVKSCTKSRIVFIDPDRYMGRFSLPAKKFESLWKDPLFTKTVGWAAFVTAPKKLR